MKVIKFRIDNETWQFTTYVRIGGTAKDAEKAFEKMFGDPKASGSSMKVHGTTTAGTLFYKHGEKCHLIWFSENPSAGILAHEALHAAYHVLREAGLGTLTADTEEAYTYLIQWITERIASTMARRGLIKPREDDEQRNARGLGDPDPRSEHAGHEDRDPGDYLGVDREVLADERDLLLLHG